jgi:hypothetical protein
MASQAWMIIVLGSLLAMVHDLQVRITIELSCSIPFVYEDMIDILKAA